MSSSDDPTPKTLEHLIHRIVLRRLKLFNGHRGKTAESLDVAVRTLSNYLKAIREKNYPIGEMIITPPGDYRALGLINKEREAADLTYSGFATNEQRLAYADGCAKTTIREEEVEHGNEETEKE